MCQEPNSFATRPLSATMPACIQIDGPRDGFTCSDRVLLDPRCRSKTGAKEIKSQSVTDSAAFVTDDKLTLCRLEVEVSTSRIDRA